VAQATQSLTICQVRVESPVDGSALCFTTGADVQPPDWFAKCGAHSQRRQGQGRSSADSALRALHVAGERHANVTSAQVADMAAGKDWTTSTVHTTKNAGGEIRGQIKKSM